MGSNPTQAIDHRLNQSYTQAIQSHRILNHNHQSPLHVNNHREQPFLGIAKNSKIHTKLKTISSPKMNKECDFKIHLGISNLRVYLESSLEFEKPSLNFKSPNKPSGSYQT